MNTAEFNEQLQADCGSLRKIVAGLDGLEEDWNGARATFRARELGYFTPDEDDRVRGMQADYRRYREGLYEIVERYRSYRTQTRLPEQLQAFMVGFAAALTLHARALKLIEVYEHEPLVRRKLNEAEARHQLEAGFFEEILGACSSLHNYRLMVRADSFWRRSRRTIQRLKLAEAADWRWVGDVIRHQRAGARRRFGKVVFQRLRYDWRAFWKCTSRPVAAARYGLLSFVGSKVARMRTTRHYQPAINARVLDRLRSLLRPGDVLLVRAEKKITSELLPGFWTHAALYVGSVRDLETLGVTAQSCPCRRWVEAIADGSRYGYVLEAVSPATRIRRLEKCLYADHVAVLRPRLADEPLRSALVEAFGQLGKPYDFAFDFNVTARIVCTGLIYRSYHKRGGIEFPLIKRFGRYTLTCDDVADLLLTAPGGAGAAVRCPWQLVALAVQLADGQTRFVAEDKATDVLRAIRGGLRPTAVSPPELEAIQPGSTLPYG